MSPFNLRLLEQMFTEALSQPTEEARELFLVELAESDPAVAKEVRSLLALQSSADQFFEAPAGDRFRMLMTTLGRGERLSESDLGNLMSLLDPPTGPGELARLGTSFVLKELISIGATGFLFRGWDCQLNRDVAIKVLAEAISKQASYRQAFVDEARLASQINHRSVATIYQVFAGGSSDHPLVYYVMEWIDGKTLQELLNEEPELIQRRSRQIAGQLTGGLSAIHARGIIHRDIKPANILIELHGDRAVIVDFGLALQANLEETLQLPAGTPLYMSPEQLLGKTATMQSDQFSFAEVVFELLTGVHPFTADSIGELLNEIIQGRPRMEGRGIALSEASKAVFRRALDRQPELRFDSIATFFERLLETLPVDLGAGREPQLREVDRPGASAARGGEHPPGLRPRGEIAPPADGPDRTGGPGRSGRVPRAGYFPYRGFGRLRAVGPLLVGLAVVTMLMAAGFTPWIVPWWSKPKPESAVGVESRRAEGEEKTAPEKDSEAQGTRDGLRWLDETTMVNFAGMEFKKYSVPRDALAGRGYPPFPARPDLTPSIDWRYNDSEFHLSTTPITHRQYLQIMGKMADTRISHDPEKEELAVTNLSFRAAELFALQMTELDPDGVRYGIPDLSQWAFAAYGEVMLRNPDQCDAIEKFLFSAGPSPLQTLSAKENAWLPRIQTPFGDSWEWVGTVKRRPQRVEGVISYADEGTSRDAAENWVVGNPHTEMFIHCFDTFCGANDYFVKAENVQLYLETNGTTQYFCPLELGRPAAITYRYQADAPILTAFVDPRIFSYHESGQCGIEVRARKPDAPIPLAEAPWVKVFEGQGRVLDQPPREITRYVQGAIEFELRYWVLTHEKPKHYAQIFRGDQYGPGNARPHYCFVQWTTARETPSVAPTGPVAVYHIDPRITARLVAYIPQPE